jgi:drug/metabolite transporter (DMT)-like permease
VIGYALYTFGLRFMEATVAAILVTVEPVMATLWAVIFLGESLTWPQITGGALVIAGVILLQYAPTSFPQDKNRWKTRVNHSGGR